MVHPSYRSPVERVQLPIEIAVADAVKKVLESPDFGIRDRCETWGCGRETWEWVLFLEMLRSRENRLYRTNWALI